MNSKGTNKTITILLIAIVLMCILGAGIMIGGYGDNCPDLDSSAWDTYFSCTASRQADGYTLQEAYKLCKASRPSGC